MPRYKCIIEYNGRNYHGMQKQKDLSVKTIQLSFEEAIYKMTQVRLEIGFAGRTDAGVHAKGQVIHFDIEKDFSVYKITNGVNFYLKEEDISILETEIVNSDFNSRFDAKMKTYNYYIINRPSRSILSQYTHYHIPYFLNMEKMKEASEFLIGMHDFTSFCNVDCQAKTKFRTVSSIEIKKNDEEIIISISAKSFLHNMVRIIVGTLIQVGREKLFPLDVKKALDLKNRSISSFTAPAHGLVLYSIEY